MHLQRLLSILSICGLHFVSVNCIDENVLVTNLGSLSGRVTQQGEKTLYSYFNIPYAKPPVGPLRFKDPLPYGGWEGVREATKCGNVCPQDKFLLTFAKNFNEIYKRSPPQSEDCLSMNVMVPGKPGDGRLRTVMVWIHGGGFAIGDGCGYDGSHLALGGDVIVVTFNYRLGALGFFSTADSTMTGNYGLKDQRLVLTWVHENIREFGGDPNSVTIFGESAGGFSVSYMSLMPENKGLFHKAIFQSGTADLLPVVEREPRNVALVVAKELNCVDQDTTVDSMDSEQMLQCLLETPWETLVDVQGSAPQKAGMTRMMFSTFYPTIDGTFITKHPHKILMESNSEEFSFFKSLDVMAGACSLELAGIAGELDMLKESMNISKDIVGAPHDLVCENFIPLIGLEVYEDTNANQYLCDSVKSDHPIIVGQKTIDLLGDVNFIAPTVNMLNKHASYKGNSKTYQYLFSLEAYKGLEGDRPDWLVGRGSDHGTDLFPLFGTDYGYGVFKEVFPFDITDLQTAMISYWTNFAKHG